VRPRDGGKGESRPLPLETAYDWRTEIEQARSIRGTYSQIGRGEGEVHSRSKRGVCAFKKEKKETNSESLLSTVTHAGPMGGPRSISIKEKGRAMGTNKNSLTERGEAKPIVRYRTSARKDKGTGAKKDQPSTSGGKGGPFGRAANTKPKVASTRKQGCRSLTTRTSKEKLKPSWGGKTAIRFSSHNSIELKKTQ